MRGTIGGELQAVYRLQVRIIQLVQRVPGQALIDHDVVAGPGNCQQAAIRVPGQAAASM